MTPGARRRGRAISPASTLMTIGHSTRTIEEFIDLLQAHGVRRIVDVRTVPRSRYNPQFNRETLPESLRAAGIEYVHMPGLGGLRRPDPDSPNTGWRNASFRGFADYMRTSEFDTNLEALIRQAKDQQVAIMCAEAVPWRCHRSLIADALTVRGVVVEHILNKNRRQPHALPSWARVRSGRPTYRAPESERAKRRQALRPG